MLSVGTREGISGSFSWQLRDRLTRRRRVSKQIVPSRRCGLHVAKCAYTVRSLADAHQDELVFIKRPGNFAELRSGISS